MIFMRFFFYDLKRKQQAKKNRFAILNDKQRIEIERWRMGSVAGRMSLSTRSADGLMDRDASGSYWMCVSLKIR